MPQGLEKQEKKRIREKNEGIVVVRGGGRGKGRGGREADRITLKLCHRSGLGKVLLTASDHQT